MNNRIHPPLHVHTTLDNGHNIIMIFYPHQFPLLCDVLSVWVHDESIPITAEDVIEFGGDIARAVHHIENHGSLG